MKNLIQKIKALFGCKDEEAVSTGKVLVHFSDGLCALADSHDDAQALVLQRCMTSMEPVYADFYEATPEDIEEFNKIREGAA